MRGTPTTIAAVLSALAFGAESCSGDSTAPAAAGAGAALANRAAVGNCLAADVAPNANGRVALARCADVAAQRFTATAAGELRVGDGLCLAAGAGDRPGAPVTARRCAGSPAQRWAIGAASAIRSAGGQCVDLAPGVPGAVTPVVLNDCRETASQHWDLRSLSVDPAPDDPAPVASVTVAPAAAALRVGATRQLGAELRDDAGGVLTGRWVWWSSADTAVATVSDGGAVTAVRPGTAAVTAFSEWHTGAATITVAPDGAEPPAAPAEVAVFPGQSIQAAVDASPAGATIVLMAGTHVRQSVVPKSGMTFVGRPGTVMDGAGAARYAFWTGRDAPYPHDVRIRGLVIEHYAPPVQMGAVRAGGHTRGEGARGWTVEDCEIRNNATGGVRLGERMRVLRNRIHHNGQIGVVGIGDDVLVEGNEIAHNNPGRAHDPGFEAGGTKFVATRGLVVRGNFVHHNTGPGLWTDGNNVGALYEGNRVEDNAGMGIFHEISYRAVIRDNVVLRNGFGSAAWVYGAGIMIASSGDVEVYGNTVADNHNGITAAQQDRTADDALYGPHLVRNVYVHDNVIVPGRGRTGVAQDVGDASVFTARNNRFVDNTYYLGDSARPFEWADGQRTEREWRAYGQDAAGVFHRGAVPAVVGSARARAVRRGAAGGGPGRGAPAGRRGGG